VAGCLKNFGMVKLPGSRRDQMEKRILATMDECISVNPPARDTRASRPPRQR